MKKIIDILKRIKSAFHYILNNKSAECTCDFNLQGIEGFTKEQKIAFNQMVDFLADMIEKYGDKIPELNKNAANLPDVKSA